MNKTKKGSDAHGAVPKRIWLWVVLVVAVVVVGGGGFILMQQQNRNTPAGALPPEISVAEAAVKRDAGAFILDVRQPEEWNQVHIPGSTLIPLGELEARVREVPQGREIVVVCRSGNRSATGRDILSDASFAQVTSMAGGVTQWQSAGYPTVSGP